MRDPADQISTNNERNTLGGAKVFTEEIGAWAHSGDDSKDALGLVCSDTVNDKIGRAHDDRGNEKTPDRQEQSVAFLVVSQAYLSMD